MKFLISKILEISKTNNFNKKPDSIDLNEMQSNKHSSNTEKGCCD